MKGSTGLTKSWKSAALAIFPHSGVGHCVALQSHSNISLGKWLSLRISIRRIYSLLCWVVLQYNHKSRYPLLIVELEETEHAAFKAMVFRVGWPLVWPPATRACGCPLVPELSWEWLCEGARALCPCEEENSGTNPNSYQQNNTNTILINKSMKGPDGL